MHAQFVRAQSPLDEKAEIGFGDKRMDSICFSVSVGSPVLIANARRQKHHGKGLAQNSPQFFSSTFSFSSISFPTFFFLCAPGVNKREGPVARKITLYMKRFTLSLLVFVCVCNESQPQAFYSPISH